MRINKKMMKADAILTADWHIRDSQPKCRTDNYYEAQWKKIAFIQALSKQNDNCPILIAGDVFDISKPSPMVLADTLKHIAGMQVICIPGQHDLPGHSIDNLYQSGLKVLIEGASGKDGIVVLSPRTTSSVFLPSSKQLVQGLSWGSKVTKLECDVLLLHTLLQEPKNSNSNIVYQDTCETILKKFPYSRLIICGDNHSSFIYKKGFQTIVNPGSLMRMDADQIDHKPSVYLWYARDNKVERVYLPIVEGVISREHIEKKQEEDSRIKAFKEKLKAKVKIKMSFEKNMNNYLLANNIKKSIADKIYTAMDK